MRILMVEDSPQDRELLRYLLEERFSSDHWEILEAPDLRTAYRQLAQLNIDVVILDLNLPDSTGKETFRSIYQRFPSVPFIVMTHNSDRKLAMTMIQEGASDYILKNYTDAEEIFRRIMFAIEKHRTSIRVPPDQAASVHLVEKTQASLRQAHESGEHQSVPTRAVEATAAVAGLSRNMFAQMQELYQTVTKIATRQEAMQKTVNGLDKELIRGHAGRRSIRSQVDILATNFENLDGRVGVLEGERPSAADWVEVTQTQVQISTTKMNNRTKILLGILTLAGMLAGAFATWYAAKKADSKPPIIQLQK